MATKRVDCMKELFSEAGMTPEMMERFHCLFEERYPQEHQSFLEGLGLDEQSIRKIRNT